MASLGLVSPGAVTNGVTYCHPSVSKKSDDLFIEIASSLPLTPLRLPRDRFSSTLCNIQLQKVTFFGWVSPPG